MGRAYLLKPRLCEKSLRLPGNRAKLILTEGETYSSDDTLWLLWFESAWNWQGI